MLMVFEVCRRLADAGLLVAAVSEPFCLYSTPDDFVALKSGSLESLNVL